MMILKVLVTATALIYSALCMATPADELKEQLSSMKTMSATFKQRVSAKNKLISQSNGNMALSRPGRFRWHTLSPMEQLVIADGQKLWIYDVDLEQVTVKKQQKSLGGTAALFLSGADERVDKDFNVTKTTQNQQTIYDLNTKNRNSTGFTRVKMYFSKHNLVRLELFDQLGQLTDVRLSNIKNQVRLNPNTFIFKIPKGVDVVRQ